MAKCLYFKLFRCLLLLVLLLIPVSVLAVTLDPTLLLGYSPGVGAPGQNSNPHNFSSQSSNIIKAVSDPFGDYDNRICIFCHTPHGGTAQSPLWNRNDPDSMTFGLFGQSLGIAIVDDPTAQGNAQYTTGQVDGYPNGSTKMCLSCHDGASAIGQMATGSPIAMSSNTITDPVMTFNPTSQGAKIAGSHPVSFIYDTTVVANINAFFGAGSNYVLPVNSSFWLDNKSRVQCTTCHNPHQDTRQANYNLPFWKNYNGVVTLAGETSDYNGTCVVCHQGTPSFNIHP